MAEKKRKLTARQQAFINEYLLDLNATQAAIRAGYSRKTAGWIGGQLLSKTHISTEIEKAKEARAKRTGITADRVLQELARVAFADPSKAVDWGPGGMILKDSSSLDADTLATVSEVSETTNKDGGTQKIKFHDKIRALEMCGRHVGIFEKDNSQRKSDVNVSGVLAVPGILLPETWGKGNGGGNDE